MRKFHGAMILKVRSQNKFSVIQPILPILYLIPTRLRRRLLRNHIWILKEVTKESTAYSLEGFEKYECIFFHIPKCAGISVAEALFDNRGASHITLTHAKLIFGPISFRRYFKFAFVRNPYDRLVSIYHYLKKGGLNKADELDKEKWITPYEDFGDFVKNGLKYAVQDGQEHLQPQFEYFYYDVKINYDFIGKYEYLQGEFNRLCDTLGINQIPLGWFNKTEHKPWQEYYTDELKEVTIAYNSTTPQSVRLEGEMPFSGEAYISVNLKWKYPTPPEVFDDDLRELFKSKREKVNSLAYYTFKIRILEE